MGNKLLKSLAINARNRLINKGAEKGNLKQRNAVYSPNVKFKIISNEDVDFIARASSLSDEDLFNPLKKLIDEAYFSKLDAYGKEKLLFDTIDKYAKFRRKVEYENSDKKVLS